MAIPAFIPFPKVLSIIFSFFRIRDEGLLHFSLFAKSPLESLDHTNVILIVNFNNLNIYNVPFILL